MVIKFCSGSAIVGCRLAARLGSQAQTNYPGLHHYNCSRGPQGGSDLKQPKTCAHAQVQTASFSPPGYPTSTLSHKWRLNEPLIGRLFRAELEEEAINAT